MTLGAGYQRIINTILGQQKDMLITDSYTTRGKEFPLRRRSGLEKQPPDLIRRAEDL
jgi:hypothetical protein